MYKSISTLFVCPSYFICAFIIFYSNSKVVGRDLDTRINEKNLRYLSVCLIEPFVTNISKFYINNTADPIATLTFDFDLNYKYRFKLSQASFKLDPDLGLEIENNAKLSFADVILTPDFINSLEENSTTISLKYTSNYKNFINDLDSDPALDRTRLCHPSNRFCCPLYPFRIVLNIYEPNDSLGKKYIRLYYRRVRCDYFRQSGLTNMKPHKVFIDLRSFGASITCAYNEKNTSLLFEADASGYLHVSKYSIDFTKKPVKFDLEYLKTYQMIENPLTERLLLPVKYMRESKYIVQQDSTCRSKIISDLNSLGTIQDSSYVRPLRSVTKYKNEYYAFSSFIDDKSSDNFATGLVVYNTVTGSSFFGNFSIINDKQDIEKLKNYIIDCASIDGDSNSESVRILLLLHRSDIQEVGFEEITSSTYAYYKCSRNNCELHENSVISQMTDVAHYSLCERIILLKGYAYQIVKDNISLDKAYGKWFLIDDQIVSDPISAFHIEQRTVYIFTGSTQVISINLTNECVSLSKHGLPFQINTLKIQHQSIVFGSTKNCYLPPFLTDANFMLLDTPTIVSLPVDQWTESNKIEDQKCKVPMFFWLIGGVAIVGTIVLIIVCLCVKCRLDREIIYSKRSLAGDSKGRLMIDRESQPPKSAYTHSASGRSNSYQSPPRLLPQFLSPPLPNRQVTSRNAPLLSQAINNESNILSTALLPSSTTPRSPISPKSPQKMVKFKPTSFKKISPSNATRKQKKLINSNNLLKKRSPSLAASSRKSVIKTVSPIGAQKKT